MTRAFIVYLLLILVPGGVLGVLAFRLVEQERRETLRHYRARLDEEADTFQKRIETALRVAALRARARVVRALAPADESQREQRHVDAVGFDTRGGEIRYTRMPPPDATASGTEELRFYALSVRGGESYEFQRNDPNQAIDAYAFYLPRVQSPVLRARLQLRIARAAAAAGDRPLATAVLRSLFEHAGTARMDNGLPIDMLAGARLVWLSDGADADLAEAVRVRLRQRHRSVSTPLLAHLVRQHAPNDESLRQLLVGRRALEASVARHTEILGSATAVLDDSHLLFAKPVLGPDAPGVRAIVRESVGLPSLTVGDFEAQLKPGDNPDATDRAVASRAVRLARAGAALATLHVRDRQMAAKIARLDRHRTINHALVVTLLVVTIGGAIVLVYSSLRAQHLARVRARLLANVTHELKTPLTSIRIFSEMLAEDPLDASRTRQYGRFLHTEVLRLSHLIEGVLGLSWRGQAEEPAPVEPVDLAAVLRRVADGFAYRAEEAETAFDVAIPKSDGDGQADGLVAVTNAECVQRIVLNLLDNALKYGRGQDARVRLSIDRHDRCVRIAVSDNGPGIPRTEREQVFKEFHRLRYDDYGVPGSGLGLTIARHLARRLGGELHLDSREGAGTTFTLELPADHKKE